MRLSLKLWRIRNLLWRIRNLFRGLFEKKLRRIRKLFMGLSGAKRIRIFVSGFDCVGKTTFLFKLWPDIKCEIPTIGLCLKTAKYKNISFTATDLSRSLDWVDRVHFLRILVLNHIENIHGFIFVVDSSDRDDISKAKDGLHLLLSQDPLKDAVLLIFANKQDLPNAMNVTEITVHLGLSSMEKRRWYVQPTCITSGDGLAEGLEWLSSELDVRETRSFK